VFFVSGSFKYLPASRFSIFSVAGPADDFSGRDQKLLLEPIKCMVRTEYARCIELVLLNEIHGKGVFCNGYTAYQPVNHSVKADLGFRY